MNSLGEELVDLLEKHACSIEDGKVLNPYHSKPMSLGAAIVDLLAREAQTEITRRAIEASRHADAAAKRARPKIDDGGGVDPAA